MKGNKQVIDALNDVLAGELTSINQYFLHARTLDNWGYKALGAKVYKESIEEMHHAQKIIDRVLFLEGLPNVQKLNKINIGQTVPEQFQSDLVLEKDGWERLKNGIKLCLSVEDHVSRELFEEILKDTEEHIDWLETQLGLIKQLGQEHYLAHQMKGE